MEQPRKCLPILLQIDYKVYEMMALAFRHIMKDLIPLFYFETELIGSGEGGRWQERKKGGRWAGRKRLELTDLITMETNWRPLRAHGVLPIQV